MSDSLEADSKPKTEENLEEVQPISSERPKDDVTFRSLVIR